MTATIPPPDHARWLQRAALQAACKLVADGVQARSASVTVPAAADDDGEVELRRMIASVVTEFGLCCELDMRANSITVRLSLGRRLPEPIRPLRRVACGRA